MIKSLLIHSCLMVVATNFLLNYSVDAKSKRSASTHPKHSSPDSVSPPQLEVFETHQGTNKTYIITLDTNHGGASLIAYNSPTCQANTHGTTRINPKNSSKLEFTAAEDPYCKIHLQKIKNNQLKVLNETAPCSTWHGDFCSFTTLPTLNRIYPGQTSKPAEKVK